MDFKKISFLLLLAGMFLTANQVFATTKTYAGVSGGSWNVAGNWSPSGVPLNGDDVIIPSGFLVIANLTDQVTSLTIESGATFSINTSITITVTGFTTVESGGTLEFASTGIMNGAGAFTLSAGSFIITSNSAGIASSGASGSVQMTSRSFSSAANYEFKNAITGVFTTTPTAQTVNNLTITRTGTTTLSQNLTVNETLTMNAGTFSVSTFTLVLNGPVVQTSGTFSSSASGTVNYAQTSAGQNIATGSYGNLTLNNFSKTFPAGILNVSGTFDPGMAAVHSISGNTLNFSGAAGQTIPAFKYYNLSSANNNRTLASSDTIHIENTFTPGSGTYTVTGSTIEFNGTGAQSVPSLKNSYNNLYTGNAGVKTLSANVTVSGILTIGAGSELDLSSRVLTLSGTGTPIIVNGIFTPSTGTVSFTGTGQTIPALNYYNLTSSSIARTLAGSGIIGIANTFSVGTGTYTIAGSTIDFNGSGTQTIPAITPNYFNLSTSNSGTKNLNASETVEGVLTVGAGTTLDLLTRVLTLTGSGLNLVVDGTFTASTGTVAFNGTSNQTIPALNYYSLTSANFDRTLASGVIGIANGFTPGSGTYTTSGSTINFNGSGTQNIPALTPAYNNVTTSVGGTKSLSASPINIDGVFTIGSGTILNGSSRVLNLNGDGTPFVIDGTFTYGTSTIAYNGTGNQNIAAADYYNLSSSDNDRTLPSGGIVGILNTYTPGTGNYTVTGSEVSFKRTTTQTIPAGTYNDITSLNFARTLASNGVISIKGSFTPGSGSYNTSTSSVEFSGSGNQTIPAFASGNYFNLSTSGGGTKTMSANLTTAGTVNVGTGTVLDLQAITLTLSAPGSPLVVDGTLNPSTSTVLYNGSGTQTIAAANYYNLSSSSFARILQPAGSIDIANTFTPGSGSYTTTGSTVNFSGSAAQDVPAAINFYNLTFTGGGTKTVAAATPTQFKTNQTLTISAPVTYSNISSIYIVNDFDGDASINSGALDITIGDDWLNTASGYTVEGEVTYTGESDVDLTIGGVDYTNLNITASRGASFPVTTTVPSPITVGGKLYVSDYATFSTGNNVTLLSGAASFANIAPLTGSASITGNVKVQTWFTGGAGKRGTRMVAPTIVETALAPGNKFYQQLKNNMIITGTGGVANGFDAGNTTQPYAVTLTKYNESATLATSQFTQVGSLSSGILPGEGFFLFYRGDRTGYDPGNPSASAALWSDYVPESFASVVNGPVAQGTVQVAISNSNNPGDTNNGYNVVGNPYVATIDWEKVYASNAADIANEIRIIQPGGAVMSRKVVDMVVSVVNGGDNLGSQYIQPGQGFYIRKTSAGAGTLTFNEAHKEVSGSPERLLKGSGQRDALQLKMSAAPGLMSAAPDYYQMYIELSDGVNRDETAIVFKEGFDANFDEIDAPYLSGSTVILSSFSADGKANAINYMPALAEVREVKLNVNAAASGVLTLNFSNISSFSGFRVSLQDNYLNTQTDVKANPVYSFSIDRSVAASFGGNRFVLLFEGVAPLQLNLSGFTAVQQHTGVLLNWSTANEQSSVRIEIERSAGNTTFSKIGEKAGAGTTTTATNYSFTDTAPLNGLNHYRLKQVYADGTFSYSEIKAVSYNKPGATPPKISFRLYPNPADNVIHIDVTGIRSKLIIYDLFGRIVKTASYENGEPVKMDISGLRTGIYFAELKDLSTKRPTDIIVFYKR